MTEKVVCVRCKQSKTVPEMVAAKRLKRGYYMYCRECDNSARRGRPRHSGPPKPKSKESIRKLPSYAVLKRHFVDQGMSITDIAEKYDVNRSAVYWTMRRRAEAFGDPWPLESKTQTRRKISKGLAQNRVSPVVIIEMVWEHVEEEWVPKTTPRRRQDPFLAGLEAFSKHHGFSMTYLKDLKNKRYQFIGKKYAARLLAAIGEPGNPALLETRRRKYAGRPWKNKPKVAA